MKTILLALTLLSFNVFATQTARMPNGDSFQAIAQGTTANEATGGSSNELVVVGAGVTIVRLAVTKAAYVKIGSTAAVTSSNGFLMPDNSSALFAVSPGDSIRHIQASEAGVISCTEGRL